MNLASSEIRATDTLDYATLIGTLHWTHGDGSAKSIPLSITSDADVEPNERFQVTLTDPSGGATLGGRTTLTVTILDGPASGLALSNGLSPSGGGGGSVGLLETGLFLLALAVSIARRYRPKAPPPSLLLLP